MNDNWLKQTVATPLFDKLLWSRPENKLHSGRVLVIGGSLGGFSKTVSSYSKLLSAGVGQVTVLLPKAVQKIIGHISSDVIYCPSTDSGSFSSESFAEMLDLSTSADGILLSGEFSNNSQTLVTIEKLVSSVASPIIVANDSFDLLLHYEENLIKKDNFVYVGSLERIQKLLTKLKSAKPITSNLALSNLVEVLKEFTVDNRLAIATTHLDYVIVAVDGKVVTTRIESGKDHTVDGLVHHVVCWVVQNPNQKLEALSCAAVTYQS